MNKSSLTFLLLTTASLAFAGDERWFIGRSAETPVDKQTAAAILQTACEAGKVQGNLCSKCPDSDDGPWSINSLIVGHFSSASAEEAIISSQSCRPENPGVGIGMLVGKRNGHWTKLQDSLSFQEQCMRRKLRSGREFLICESWHYSRDGEVTYSLGTTTVEGDALKGRELFTAIDQTRSCVPQGQVEKAAVQNVDFRDLNGDGLEDISITATYGAFQMTERRHQQCIDATDDLIHSVGNGAREFPQPPVTKTYKIQYLFDGNRYTLTPESRAAAELFDPKIDHTPVVPPPATFSVTSETAHPLGTPSGKPDAATFQAFCGAPIVDGECKTPISRWETVGNWTLRDYRFGHFISPGSEDAIVTAITVGVSEVATRLFTRKSGKWEVVPSALLSNADIRDCVTVHLKTGLDRLACLDTTRSVGYRAGLWITGTINVLVGSGDELMFRELIHSANNLTNCSSERPDDDPIENSVFDKIETGDPNRTEGPDLIVTARYGEREATQQTERQCKAALARRAPASFPAPRLSTFRLEYNFDGLPIKDSLGVIPTPETQEKATNYFNHLSAH